MAQPARRLAGTWIPNRALCVHVTVSERASQRLSNKEVVISYPASCDYESAEYDGS